MNYQDLRAKYPVFSFDKFTHVWENNSLKINFFYSANNLNFIHELIVNSVPKKETDLDKYIFDLGLSILPSYWKLTCSPTIQIPCQLSPDQISFWHKLFIQGMGEYFYKNQIDFTQNDFLTVKCTNTPPYPTPNLGEGIKGWSKNKVLVPVGGGKDSIVTLELLKSHFRVTALVINPVPLISAVIKQAGVPLIVAENIFDPELFELNKQGFLNGHVPVSAFYAFCSLLTAHLLDIPYVAISDERSSGEGNTNYLGREINHQYSKTLEFETDLNGYVSSPKYFSFLRPLYELQITKLFCNYPQYFPIFSSCNQNFKIQHPTSNVQSQWCSKCPKCVSTALMLTCFIGKDKVTEIMDGFPPDLPTNLEIVNQLTGKNPIKPFECVLTRAEANAALTGENFEQIINSWEDNPNMPEEFGNILKKAITSPF